MARFGEELGLESNTDLGRPSGLAGVLTINWRHGADDRRLRHVLIAMTGEITHHLAAAGRMADVNRIPQVEMVSDGIRR